MLTLIFTLESVIHDKVSKTFVLRPVANTKISETFHDTRLHVSDTCVLRPVTTTKISQTFHDTRLHVSSTLSRSLYLFYLPGYDLAAAACASVLPHLIIKRHQRRRKMAKCFGKKYIEVNAHACSKQCIAVCTGHLNIVYTLTHI